MSAKLTKEKWIERSKLKHNNKYDYSLVEYTGIDNILKIVCPIHGIFEQKAYIHSNMGCGCTKCSKKKLYKSTEYFINQAKEVHGDKYDYSKSIYIKNSDKLEIICPEHGSFFQTPANHLSNHACKKCFNKKLSESIRFTNEEIIKKFRNIHGNIYDYSKFKYSKSKIKSTIICKLHGDFLLDASTHIVGVGCAKCGREKATKSSTKTINEFLFDARRIHGDIYDYSLINYKGVKDKVQIICKRCNHIFFQTPDGHCQGKGCRDCGNRNNYHKSNWIKKAKEREGIFYIIKCWNQNEEFYKLGITYRSVKIRHNTHNMPYNYEIIKEVKSKDLDYIWRLEKRFKKWKRKQHYKPLIHFLGDKFECFK